jgi:hypothetical protein
MEKEITKEDIIEHIGRNRIFKRTGASGGHSRLSDKIRPQKREKE